MTRILFWLALVFLVVLRIACTTRNTSASRHHRATLARPARPVRPAPPRRPSPKPRPCCAAPTAPSIIRRRKTCAATAAITAAPRTSDCRRHSVDGAPAGIVGRIARHLLALAANDERRARRHRRGAAGLPELRQPWPARLRPLPLR